MKGWPLVKMSHAANLHR